MPAARKLIVGTTTGAGRACLNQIHSGKFAKGEILRSGEKSDIRPNELPLPVQPFAGITSCSIRTLVLDEC